MKYLYHLTDRESANRILRTGLKPKTGERSQVAQEEGPRIYLADKESVPYWKLLLGKDILLRIDVEKLDAEKLEEYRYQEYAEWTYPVSIKPEWIHESRVNSELNPERYRELCLSIIDSISYACVQFARYVSYRNDPESDWREFAKQCKESCVTFRYTLPKLDFFLFGY